MCPPKNLSVFKTVITQIGNNMKAAKEFFALPDDVKRGLTRITAMEQRTSYNFIGAEK